MKEEFDPKTFESANITLPSGPEGTQPLVDTDASTAAGLVVGLGKLGVDVGWLNYFDFGVLSLNALLLIAASLVADEDTGPAGDALRTVGTATSALYKTFEKFGLFLEKKEVGITAQAIALLAVESALVGYDEAKAREKARAEAKAKEEADKEREAAKAEKAAGRKAKEEERASKAAERAAEKAEKAAERAEARAVAAAAKKKAAIDAAAKKAEEAAARRAALAEKKRVADEKAAARAAARAAAKPPPPPPPAPPPSPPPRPPPPPPGPPPPPILLPLLTSARKGLESGANSALKLVESSTTALQNSAKAVKTGVESSAPIKAVRSWADKARAKNQSPWGIAALYSASAVVVANVGGVIVGWVGAVGAVLGSFRVRVVMEEAVM